VLQQVDLAETDWLADVLGGEPAFVDDRDEFARRHPNAGVLRIYPTGSWAAIPFRSEGTVGLLSVHYQLAQELSSCAVYFSLVAEILATALQRAASDQVRAKHLVELEQSLAERDRIARTLSTTLLPPRLPPLPGFTAAAWLQPASAGDVAGDFYDLFAVATGGWVAVLGDVCGKGAEAAAVTSLARYATRVTALDDPDPARIAGVANHALTLDDSDLFCTMALVRYLPGADQIDVTLAGHPQARLIHDGEVTRAGQFGPALGLGTQPHRTTTHPFLPGDSIVLFSDGLIERDQAFGEVQLDEHLARHGPSDADGIAQRLRDLVLGLEAHHTDDVAILVVTRDA
jgi:sigma-B regulation protein RsbU (phosphoserine phosphatase)